MKVLRAILSDSLREVMDRRALLVLLILETLVVVFCFGVSFQSVSPEEALEKQIGSLNTFTYHSGDTTVSERKAVTFKAVAVNPISGNAYLSVARGTGPKGGTALLKVTRKGDISEVSLTKVRSAKATPRRVNSW